MTLYRVFRKSTRFTFRSKRRFFVFLLIFAIVSTLVAFNVDQLESLTTDELLDQKGVVVKKAQGTEVDFAQGQALYQDILDYADSASDLALESHKMFTYVDIDENLRIHSLDIDNPWLSDFANPSLVQDGSYPGSENEILVPEGALQSRDINVDSGNYQLNSLLSVGQQLSFSDAAETTSVDLEVSGTFDDTRFQIDNNGSQLWLFMDQAAFDDMVELFGLSEQNDVKIYMLSFVVEGLILTQETYERADRLNQEVKTFLEDPNYDGFRDVPESLPLQSTLDTSNTILVTLSFVVIGGIILSTLFSYLISRFRRREIAILKAMGYSHSAVRTSLFAEILTTSFSGFLLGLGIAQVLLVVGLLNVISGNGSTTTLDFNNLISFPAVGAAFLIMVVISLPGMWLASRRILSVSPAEAFRDN